jgi:hypothetical protein
MLDGAMNIFRTTLTIVAVLVVLYVVGIVGHKGATGMTAVGDGIGDIFRWAFELLGTIAKAL